VAGAFWAAQRSLIRRTVKRVQDRTGTGDPVCAGIGAPLISEMLGGSNLRQEIGPAADMLPAFAVREVALRDPGSWR
jgi:hypothetical protein